MYRSLTLLYFVFYVTICRSFARDYAFEIYTYIFFALFLFFPTVDPDLVLDIFRFCSYSLHLLNCIN